MSNLSLAIFIGTWEALKLIFEIKIQKLHIFALFWVGPKGDIYMKGQHRVLFLLPKIATDVAKNFRSCKGRSELSVDIFMASWNFLVVQKSQFQLKQKKKKWKIRETQVSLPVAAWLRDICPKLWECIPHTLQTLSLRKHFYYIPANRYYENDE